jgi:hypothetical protein
MAKGIERIIAKFCVQTCVYWGNPVKTTFGFTFDDPVEIKCRWEDVTEIDIKITGNIALSKGSVLVTQDLDRFGYLYLGTLDDFDSSVDLEKPINIPNANIIHRFDKIPMVMKTDEFVRIAWLYDQGK